MTDAEIIAEFTRREREANAKPRGADHPQILADVSRLAERPLEDVRRIILDSTVFGAN